MIFYVFYLVFNFDVVVYIWVVRKGFELFLDFGVCVRENVVIRCVGGCFWCEWWWEKEILDIIRVINVVVKVSK